MITEQRTDPPTDGDNHRSEANESRSSKADQLLRAILAVGILLITPFVVVLFLFPIVFSHPLGIIVAIFILVMIGTGLYIIAEGDIPSIFRR